MAGCCCADIPASRVVAGVRVGLLPEVGFVVNPTMQQMEESQLDLVIAGTSSAVLMIEGYCDFLTEDQMIEVRPAGWHAELCGDAKGACVHIKMLHSAYIRRR